MTNIEAAGFTEAQWRAMCNANMSLPVTLAAADLTQPFVYARGYGVFYVPWGSHYRAMATLLAFANGLACPLAVAAKLHLNHVASVDCAELWLRTTPGACFRSPAGKNVIIGTRGNLTVIERRRFGAVTTWMTDRHEYFCDHHRPASRSATRRSAIQPAAGAVS